ncbi:MAG: hypothetical protein WCT12_29830, partial [Verrucomicrobiota bacterium]
MLALTGTTVPEVGLIEGSATVCPLQILVNRRNPKSQEAAPTAKPPPPRSADIPVCRIAGF